MLKREPDLIRLLELPLQPDCHTPLDLEAFRRQIKYALRLHNDYDYPDIQATATELSALVDNAASFLEGGDWANAGALYALILDEVIPLYEELYDENGDVALVLQACAQGLGECLENDEAEVDTRQKWLESLLDAEFKDIAMGGIDLAYPASDIILDQATDEEWIWIEKRVREAIAAQSNRYSNWGQDTLVSFLASRYEVSGQESHADELILEMGSPQQQAFLLVQQERFAEAVAVAKANFTGLPGLVIQFADALVAAGGGSAAEEYMAGLLDTRSGASYLDWLAQYAQQRDDLPGALNRWQQSFDERPSIETYRALRDVAHPLEQWESLRPELLSGLELQEQWTVLIDIALDEADIPRALELLPKLKWGWGGWNAYDRRVAEAAEADDPEAALQLYQRLAEQFIEARGRENYREAVNLLATKVQGLYRKLDKQENWHQYIAHLRQEHKRLPALQDEMNKARL